MTFWEMLGTVLLLALKSFVLLAALLVFIAYALLADRKIWAAVQLRRGPNVVGPFGLFQSFADLIKFVIKEPVIPAGANKAIYLLAPLVFAMLALSSWAVIPLADGWAIADINVGITYIFAISSLGVYGVIMGGWASNSKYAFLGALRSAAQMISYEVSLGFVIICVLLCAGSLNLSRIVMAQDTALGLFGWYWLWLFPMFVVFFVSALAETNRPPFDLPEAESELVAGFMVEYSSTPYLLFMAGEYIAIWLMCALISLLFFGGRFSHAVNKRPVAGDFRIQVQFGGLYRAVAPDAARWRACAVRPRPRSAVRSPRSADPRPRHRPAPTRAPPPPRPAGGAPRRGRRRAGRA